MEMEYIPQKEPGPFLRTSHSQSHHLGKTSEIVL